MTHENKNNEAPGNKASEIKKNVVELNENDLSKVAGGGASFAVDTEGQGPAGLQDDVVRVEGLEPVKDITIDDGTV